MLRPFHHPLRRFPSLPPLRRFSAVQAPPRRTRYLFIDAFPGAWDVRWHWARRRDKPILEALKLRLANVKAHGFNVVSLEPYHKDGGVWCTFEFTAVDEDAALKTIKAELKKEAEKHGGLPSWDKGSGAQCWLVEGKPWVEDMQRWASNLLRVTFDGPYIHDDRLYEILRPYGIIQHMWEPLPTPPSSLRSACVMFKKHRSATLARNAVHGLEVWANGAKSPTRLMITYAHPLDGHKIQDFMARHPRIVFPILIFLLGSLALTIFEPIRCLTVRSKIEDWFDVREFRLYQWLRTISMELRIFNPRPEAATADETWKERTQAEAAVRAYITDWPATIAFVHGPQGSGKTGLVDDILKGTRRKSLIIDCRALQNATSDAQVITVLARQTGYWPFFSFLGSIHHLIDLASVGLIGQKTNLSSTLPEKVSEMLTVVRKALKNVGSSHRRPKIRLDEDNDRIHRARSERAEAVEALPIVVIRHFDGRGSNREDIYDVLAEWAASLIESQLAHVIVISDNRENTKRLAKVLPSKPLNTIALYDADAASALAFVKRKLEDAHIKLEYTQEQVTSVQRLGGRATDLESLIYKVRNGASVEDAVEDIIHRETSEVRKKAFGDDAEDAKNLLWGREQAWLLFKQLSQKSELPYHQVLLEFPFKGDEAPLRSMEHAELISIGTHNGRPSTIRPGKPVFRAVFERLVNDSIFRATQDIAFNEKMITGEETTVKACEQELLSLKEIGRDFEHWWGGNAASSTRSRYLLTKMQAATLKIEALERRNIELKKVLAKGG
ncbi:RNA12 protein-domain-containing protein [Mycena sanguinolenta]|nr:RNA12 protein-domain-containing protein [Mycena sanguinolenta]